MFGDTGSNRDVRPESTSHRRHREEKFGGDTSGVGEGSVALPAGREDLRPHHERLPLPASRLCSTGAFLGAPYRNPHIGLPDPFRIVVLCGETTVLEGRRVSC